VVGGREEPPDRALSVVLVVDARESPDVVNGGHLTGELGITRPAAWVAMGFMLRVSKTMLQRR
jgi:hypothetical protein